MRAATGKQKSESVDVEAVGPTHALVCPQVEVQLVVVEQLVHGVPKKSKLIFGANLIFSTTMVKRALTVREHKGRVCIQSVVTKGRLREVRFLPVDIERSRSFDHTAPRPRRCGLSIVLQSAHMRRKRCG